MASVVVLFYVKHVDSVSNTGCLIYVFGVVEQIWVLMDQSLVTFEMDIIDLTQTNRKPGTSADQKLAKAHATANLPHQSTAL
jgi:hypothetical protein